MEQIRPRQLEALLAREGGDAPLLLDVREPWELEICRIEGAERIPMRRIPASLHQLEPDRPVVVICHHGIRSQQVALYLERQGFSQVYNLQGGVDGWARDVDPTMPTY
ncbi:MAG: rhodanese-like domain-containing protein [Thiohalocapsa sp.]|jgi:rhodanese-related sulfurtransferase